MLVRVKRQAGDSFEPGTEFGEPRHLRCSWSYAVTPLSTFFLSTAIICLASSWYFAVAIVPMGLGPAAPTVEQGLFPEWLGCREILLHGRDPYRAAVTEQNQAVIHAPRNVAPGDPRNQHRFAYPVFFAVLFSPLAVLPFAWAQLAALPTGIVLTIVSVYLWMPGEAPHASSRLTYLLFVFAGYPFIVALQLRQPTLVIAGLLALVFFWFRSGHLVTAGALAALCSSKPQIAIAVLLPLAIASLADWRRRRAFVLSFAATLSVLLLAAEMAVPHWLPCWLNTVRAYSHYAGSQPLLIDLVRSYLLVPAYLLLIGAVVFASLRFHRCDLLFAVSFSIAVFQLLFPFQIYNEVLLLPAALWMATMTRDIQPRRQFPALLRSCTWIVLGFGWASSLVLSAVRLMAPAHLPALWQAPLLAAYLYPFAMFASLAVYAVMDAATAAQPQWDANLALSRRRSSVV